MKNKRERTIIPIRTAVCENERCNRLNAERNGKETV